jgi:predicted ferric reductase
MAFIISKKTQSRGNEIRLYYLVKNYREGKKIKRITLAKLGICKDLKEALVSKQKRRALIQQKKENYENRLNRVKQGDTTAYIFFCPPWKQQVRMKKCIEEYDNEINELGKDELNLISLSS